MADRYITRQGADSEGLPRHWVEEAGGPYGTYFAEEVLILSPVSVTGSIEVSNDVGNPLPVSGTVTANEGGIWQVRLQDGTTAQLAVIDAAGDLQTDVNNFPSTYDVSDRSGRALGQVTFTSPQHVIVDSGSLTIAQGNQGTVAQAWFTRDDYQTGETLPDQTGAGAVLTFTFSAAVQLVVIEAKGTNQTARADLFSGTPSATQGVVCDDAVPTYVPVNATVVKVFAPTGMVVAVYGLRRS